METIDINIVIYNILPYILVRCDKPKDIYFSNSIFFPGIEIGLESMIPYVKHNDIKYLRFLKEIDKTKSFRDESLNYFLKNQDLEYLQIDCFTMLYEIPEGCTVKILIIKDSYVYTIPKESKIKKLIVNGNVNEIKDGCNIKYIKLLYDDNFLTDELLEKLPLNTTIEHLEILNSNIISKIPEGYSVKYLEIHGYNTISEIPEGCLIENLLIYGANTISKLPKKHHITNLYIDGYNTINEIPEDFKILKLEIYGDNEIKKIPKNCSIKNLTINGKYLKYYSEFN